MHPPQLFEDPECSSCRKLNPSLALLSLIFNQLTSQCQVGQYSLITTYNTIIFLFFPSLRGKQKRAGEGQRTSKREKEPPPFSPPPPPGAFFSHLASTQVRFL